MSLSILILAAGKGVRMKSDLPKVLHTVGGIPMIDRVVRSSLELKPSNICIIVGHKGSDVRSHLIRQFPKHKLRFAVQKNLNGSGGAVRQAQSWIKKQKGYVVVTCGDAPLLTSKTFRVLAETHSKDKNLATVLTSKIPDPAGYGRIVRYNDGSVQRIVEHLDATEKEKQINEINTGTYCFDAAALASALPLLQNKNAKKEFYLTDVLSILRERGRVGAVVCPDFSETLGINSRLDLAKAEKAIYQRKVENLMAEGVTVIDPSSCFIGDEVQVGSDTIIWPQTFLLGQTKIGSGCQLGPWTHIKNCVIENKAIIQASFCDDSIIRQGARVGPYSRVRPNSDIGPDVHLGNFSEVKNTKIAAGSKANHLSYLGDAKIGKNANIGAGTITCNYDGIKKSPTHIQDHAFIGSNVNLIAPVRVGAHAVIGAGSSVADNVPSWALALERAPILIKKNWAKRKFKKGK